MLGSYGMAAAIAIFTLLMFVLVAVLARHLNGRDARVAPPSGRPRRSKR